MLERKFSIVPGLDKIKDETDKSKLEASVEKANKRIVGSNEKVPVINLEDSKSFVEAYKEFDQQINEIRKGLNNCNDDLYEKAQGLLENIENELSSEFRDAQDKGAFANQQDELRQLMGFMEEQLHYKKAANE